MDIEIRDLLCPECQQVTQEKIEAVLKHNLEHPIYKTDFTKPLSQLLEEIREKMAEVRGLVQDILAVDTSFHDRIKPAEGLLTCGISSLYNVVTDVKRFERACKQRGEIPRNQLPKKEIRYK